MITKNKGIPFFNTREEAVSYCTKTLGIEFDEFDNPVGIGRGYYLGEETREDILERAVCTFRGSNKDYIIIWWYDE
jgi:hypothetical protein